MSENKKIVHINDKEYKFNFPNAFYANLLQDHLGIDVVQDSSEFEKNPQFFLRKLKTEPYAGNKEKSDEFVKRSLMIIMGDDATDEMVNSFSPFDLAKIYTLFFSEMLIPKVNFNGELKLLENILKEAQAKEARTDTHSPS